MRAPFTPWAERPGTIVAPSKPPTLYPLTTHQLAVQGRPNPLTGKLYTGGYYKGHFALVGVTDSGEVAPEPSATLWGDANSDVQVRTARHVHGIHLYLNPSCRPRGRTVPLSQPSLANRQNLYVAETDETGKMTKSWSMKGTGIQSGSPGHGAIVNRVQVDGVRAMLDRSHLAIKALPSPTLTPYP